jgi:hypothetical protein
MNGTIANALPDIPRLYTAICEWLACVVYLSVMYRRAPQWRTVLTVGMGLPTMIAIQHLNGSVSLDFWVFGMLLAFGAMYLIVVVGSGTSGREGLYITARAFVLAELIASLHWQIVTTSRVGTTDGPRVALGMLGGFVSRALPVIVLVVSYTVFFGTAWAIERHNFSRSASVAPGRATAIGAVAITIVTFAMSNLSFITTNTPFSGQFGREVFYIRTLVDLCGYTILYAQQEQTRALQASAELNSIEARLQSEHQEYLQSKENIESLGRIAHDLKHQITALRAEVDPEHVASGFDGLEASVKQYSAQQHTGNPVLDVIITSKSKAAAHRGITFTVVADGKLLDSLSSVDIATLFGNALDNAIEATAAVADPERRQIKLALYSRGDFTVIRVENYYESPVSRDSEGNFLTTKIDANTHGFGVKSIRHIAAQYGGNVTIKTENQWFVLTVLLPR